MIPNPRHTLTFGSITMVSNGTSVPSSGVRYILRPSDTTWGNPEPVTQALISLMRIGGPVAWDHTENRQPVLRVTIEATNSDLLAQGERALQLECEKPNTLTWTPPDGAGTTSVFDIVWSQMELVFDDEAELNLQRTYLIRMQALPHARAASLVATPANSSSTTTVVINDGSSATGWTANTNTGSTVSVVSGAVVSTYDPDDVDAGFYGTYLRLAATVDVSVTKYIAVDWKTSLPVVYGFSVNDIPNGNLSEVRRETVGTFTRSYYLIPDSITTLSALQFGVIHPANSTATATLSIDQVQRTNRLPFTGSDRQKAMSIVPGGSVRTQGSIQVWHATAALGKTIVYTHPSGTGYLPPLRPWLVSSATVTTDSSMISGARNEIAGTASDFRVPVPVLPEGDVQLWARLSCNASGTYSVSWSADSWLGSTNISGSQLGSTPVTWGTAGSWVIAPLAQLSLPVTASGPSGYVRISLNAGASPVITLDEAWLFAMDKGRLTVVECGSGTPTVGSHSNRLWVDAPSLDQPQGGVWRGNAADRSDAWHAGGFALPWQIHEFDPLGTNVFVVTENTTDASTSLEHYRRYHTHVATV